MKNLLKLFLIILTSVTMYTSCDNDLQVDEPLQSTETDEIEVGEDLSVVYVENTKTDPGNKAASVQLGKVVVFLSRKNTASGTLKFKVVRSSDNKVLTTSSSLNVSALTTNSLGNACNNQPFTKVSFNLNSNTAKVTVGEKYRVEIHCSKNANDGGKDKNTVYLAYQNANVYPIGCSTYTDIPLKHCGLDFAFESWNFNANSIRVRDQSQNIKRCARSINDDNNKIAGQEFIVGQ